MSTCGVAVKNNLRRGLRRKLRTADPGLTLQGRRPVAPAREAGGNFRQPLAHRASRNFSPDAAHTPRAPAVAYPTAHAAPEVVVSNNLKTIVRTAAKFLSEDSGQSNDQHSGL